ncbi:MAG: hypothetical protein WD066_11685 [Planctomycetaceae bacterium]
MLIVVLVVILLLTLGAYAFTTSMVAEANASRMYLRDAQTRALADSGIEMVAAILGNQWEQPESLNLYDNRDLFAGMVIVNDPDPLAIGRVSIIAPLETDPLGRMVRYGPIDESGKLNLNVLSESGLSGRRKKESLMRLPNMTDEAAESILDWLDPDPDARQSGAEVQYYGSLDPPYAPRNGRIDSLDELLLVRGVTPWLLYGVDANRNGLVDPQEDLGDGAVNLGWAAYLTVHSRESNRRPDGRLKIDVNQEDLAALYDAVAAELDEDTAKFIVAFRMHGAATDSGSQEEPAGGGSQGGSQQAGGQQGGGQQGGGQQGGGQQGGGQQGGGQQGGGQQGGGQQGVGQQGGGQQGGGQQGGGQQGGGQRGGGGGRGGRASFGAATNAQLAASRLMLAAVFAQAGSSQGTADMRGGLDLSGGGSETIISLYDLVGITVSISPTPNEGEETEDQILESPWSADADELAGRFALAEELLTTSTEEVIEGRINIMRARREVLLSIPGMREDTVEAILGAQAALGSAGIDSTGTRGTTAWLLGEGLVDLATMRGLDPFITAKGDVYRVQAVGFIDGGGPICRQEAIIDATEFPPRILGVRDLTSLGRGYTQEQLLGGW